ncbi:MAG: tetratricopeptide repeat protein [Elusimicrobiota bacterium]
MIKRGSLVILSGIFAVSVMAAFAQDKNTAVVEAEKTAQQETAAAEVASSAKKPDIALPPAAEPKPKAGTPTAAPAKTAVAADLARTEWEFLKIKGADKDEDVLTLILPQLSDWLFRNPENEYAGEALLLKANLQLKLGDYKSAVIDLMRHMREYPQASSVAAAGKLFIETLDKKIDKKAKPRLVEISKGQVAEKTDAIAGLLEKTAEHAGDIFYESLTAEFRDFFNRFPYYGKKDEMLLALADLHFKNEEYLPSRLAYEKMIQMSAGSRLLPRAKNSLGGVLADHLKEYDAAIVVYRDIAASCPGTEEAWTAYGRLPKLAEKQEQYSLAVEIYETIIALYPDKPESYAAFQSEARVLREELSKPAEAVVVLNRLADKYKDEKAIEAVFLAAEIARKDMKDYDLEVKNYDRIVSEYPSDPQAPKAMFAAAEAYEKGKNLEKAREYFSQVIVKYAENPLAQKAQKRLNSMATQ